jgi:hypothetical protein
MSFDHLLANISQYLVIVASANCTNEQLKQASSNLQKLFVTEQAIPCLVQIISTSENIGVRQLASVEVRKIVQKKNGGFWEQLDMNIREQIKNQLLELSVRDQRYLILIQ